MRRFHGLALLLVLGMLALAVAALPARLPPPAAARTPAGATPVPRTATAPPAPPASVPAAYPPPAQVAATLTALARPDAPYPPPWRPTPTVTPTPGPIDAAAMVMDYLNAHGADLSGLRTLLQAHGWLGRGRDMRCITASAAGYLIDMPPGGCETELGGVRAVDLDGDGQDEIIVIITPPAEPIQLRQSDMLILTRLGGRYEPVYRAVSSRVLSDGVYYDITLNDAALVIVADVNRDDRVEVVTSTHLCGAATCFIGVEMIHWDGLAYRMVDGLPLSLSYSDITLGDLDGDGVMEIVMHGGGSGLAGEGPVRQEMRTYRWDGYSYTLAEARYDASDLLYFKLIDANHAYRTGALAGAAGLYREALDDRALRGYFRDADGLRAFAGFRLMLCHLRLGQHDAAEAVLARLEADYAAQTYTALARRLWDVYATSGLGTACQAVTAYALEHPAEVGFMYGPGNPGNTWGEAVVSPSTLCSGGQ